MHLITSFAIDDGDHDACSHQYTSSDSRQIHVLVQYQPGENDGKRCVAGEQYSGTSWAESTQGNKQRRVTDENADDA